MELVARAEEMELPSGFVEFSNCLGMPIAGFEKEICALIRKMESRKGWGIRMSWGKKRCSSHFEREIQKSECSVGYNSSPFTARGKGSGAGVWGKRVLLVVGFSRWFCFFCLVVAACCEGGGYFSSFPSLACFWA